MRTLITRTILALAMPALMVGCITSPPKIPQEKLTVDYFTRTATVKDDALEVAATITTQYGWQPPSNFLVGSVHDTYFRAFVDKKSGATIYQVFTWLRYPGDTWRHYGTANYETPQGPVSQAITRIGQPGVDCSSRTIGCVYTEYMGFDVPEPVLRELAEVAKTTPGALWRFRLKARAGVDYDGSVTVAEAAGLLNRVDQFKQSKGLTK